MAARGGDKLSDKDLIRVAENMLAIALEYLEFQKNEIDVSKANAKAKENPTQEFHFDLLAKWTHKKGSEGTRKNLYDCLIKASSDKGLIDRARLAFLLELVRLST